MEILMFVYGMVVGLTKVSELELTRTKGMHGIESRSTWRHTIVSLFWTYAKVIHSNSKTQKLRLIKTMVKIHLVSGGKFPAQWMDKVELRHIVLYLSPIF